MEGSAIMMQSLLIQAIFAVLFVARSPVNPLPSMGPAEVVIKYTEKCKFSMPTLLDMNARLYSRKGKVVLAVNATFPFPFSDEIAYDMNVAVKKSGGWKPNFLKFRGDGVCSGVKLAQPDLYQEVARQLKAPHPVKCPFPPGRLQVDFAGTDPTEGMKKYGLEVMPYGEFRITANFSYKGDIFFCCRCFLDLTPKKGRGK